MIPKYRAWDKLLKQMYYPEDFKITFNRGETVISTERELGWVDWEEKHINKDVFLMQSTGLKDKNGVEIYEGDCLSLIHLDENVELKGEVVYSEGSFCMTVRLKGRQYKVPLHEIANSDSVITVLGNICENKEVEKEKRYILKFSNGQYLYSCDLGMTDESLGCKLTQAEIESVDPRLMQFAKEVE